MSCYFSFGRALEVAAGKGEGGSRSPVPEIVYHPSFISSESVRYPSAGLYFSGAHGAQSQRPVVALKVVPVFLRSWG
jgi:hypothetical protein